MGPLTPESGQTGGSSGLGRRGSGLERVRGYVWPEHVGHPGACGLTICDQWGRQVSEQEEGLVLGWVSW